MKPLYIHDVIESSMRMKIETVSDGEFMFAVLLAFNENVLNVATRLPVDSELRAELLGYSQRTLPARFAGYVSEGWNGIKNDPIAREYLEQSKSNDSGQ